jgi:hypothetical protein
VTDRQVFGVVVRVLGIILAGYGFLELESGLAHWIDPAALHRFSVAAYFVVGSIAVCVGAFLVKAEWLVGFAYGRNAN